MISSLQVKLQHICKGKAASWAENQQHSEISAYDDPSDLNGKK